MHRSATDIHNVVFFHTGFKSIRLNVSGQITLACKSIDRTDCLHQELIWMVFYLLAIIAQESSVCWEILKFLCSINV